MKDLIDKIMLAIRSFNDHSQNQIKVNEEFIGLLKEHRKEIFELQNKVEILEEQVKILQVVLNRCDN